MDDFGWHSIYEKNGGVERFYPVIKGHSTVDHRRESCFYDMLVFTFGKAVLLSTRA